MTAVASLIADFERDGIRLEARGDRLHFRADRPVTPAERERLTANKRALMVFLGVSNDTGDDPNRDRLLTIAAAERIPAHNVHALPVGALDGCERYSDDSLRRWLHYRAASADPEHVARCTCKTWLAADRFGPFVSVSKHCKRE